MAKQRKKKSLAAKGRSLIGLLTSRVLLLSAAGMLMLSYVSMLVNPAISWLFAIFCLPYFLLVCLNVFLLIWALFRRSKAFWIPLVAILPALLCLGRYVQLSNDTPSGVSDNMEEVKVVSYNVGRFAPSKANGAESRTACLDSVAAFLRKTDADIICLQEFYLPSGSNTKNIFRKKFKGYNAEYYFYVGEKGSCGNVTLSRYPVRDKAVIKFDNSTNLALYTDHKINGKMVRIYNCHLESYNVSIPGVVKALAGRDDTYIQETGKKMKGSILRRPKQVDKILRDISGCPSRALICGDFNDTPISYTYQSLSRGRKDAFREAGHGFGATYSLLQPFLRIDYILYPKEFGTLSYDVPKVPYSDHYPVISELAI